VHLGTLRACRFSVRATDLKWMISHTHFQTSRTGRARENLRDFLRFSVTLCSNGQSRALAICVACFGRFLGFLDLVGTRGPTAGDCRLQIGWTRFGAARGSMEPEVCQEPWMTALGGCCAGTLRANRFASGAERFQAFRRLSEAFFAERNANGKVYLQRFYWLNAIMLHMLLGLCCRGGVFNRCLMCLKLFNRFN
jgi:hypothetical protein